MVAFNRKFIDCYQSVPKDLVDNLQFRLTVRNQANKDAGYRRALREICSTDPLFFMNTFGWLYEPRRRFDRLGNKLPKVIPFITWTHQDPVILQMRSKLGEEDIVLEKSRGEGASWIAIWLSLQDWCFGDMVTIGYVSKSKEAVYNGKDPNSLFWKLDFGRNRLPPWMVGFEDKISGWERNIADNTFINNRLGNTIIGYAATGTMASGGRTEWFLFDELSKFPRPDDAKAVESVQSITESRLIVGTPFGSTGAYYDCTHEQESENTIKLRLHWSDNPSKNRGLYRMVNGRPLPVDPVNNPMPAEYRNPTPKVLALFARLQSKGYNLEKGLRSPWYDKQCDRLKATPQSIAQELDIDYGGSSYQRFGSEFFKVVAKTVQPPLIRGNITFREGLKPSFDYNDQGQFMLWCDLDQTKDGLRPPRGQYGVSCDIGSGFAGSYTSNSTIIVINHLTQEQVMEFATNNIQQSEFADLAIATAKWFWDAKLGWESNFASGFTERVLEQNYANVFLRPILGKRSKRQSARQEVGWWTDNRKTKPLMFDDIDFFVRGSKAIVRSQALKGEFAQYIYDEKHNVECEGHAGDATHGDRVIGFGVGIQMMKEHRRINKKNSKANPPPNTMEAREREWDLDEQRQKDDWDHRTPADLVGSRSSFIDEREDFGWA